MKDIINNIFNTIKNKKVLFSIMVGLSATIILTIAIVLGVVISSKITCKHDNSYEIEILPYKAATYQEEGLTSGKKCNYCGKTFVSQEIIPITDCNKKEKLPYKAPTCIETGLTEGKKCSVCGKITLPQQTLTIINCQESAWIVDLEPTKTIDGFRHTECLMCGKTMKTQVLASGSKWLTYYDQKNGTYLVNGTSYSDPDLVIPRMYNECRVIGIQYYAFTFNKYIESLKTPNTITFIGTQAFYGCENLKTIILAEGLENIALGAFARCTSLVSITLPSTLKFIGSEAFNNCTSLTTIVFEGTVEQWNAVSLGSYWNATVPATEVICSDGTVTLE